VAGGEGRHLVEKEELGEAAWLQQRMSVPAAKLEPAGDPAFAGVPAPNPATGVMEAAAVSVDETSCGIRDDVAKWRDPILQRHLLRQRSDATSEGAVCQAARGEQAKACKRRSGLLCRCIGGLRDAQGWFRRDVMR
jgi:hypothetical protein